MANMFAMQPRGFDEVKAMLKDLRQNQADRMLRKGVRAAGEVFREEEAERAPERPDLPSTTALQPGELKDGVIMRRYGKNGLIVGPSGYTSQAAHLVEYGHRLVKGGKSRLRAHGITVGPGTEIGWVKPYPYARPTFEAVQEAAFDACKQSVADDVSRLHYRMSVKGGSR
jgi:hypothetical protein